MPASERIASGALPYGLRGDEAEAETVREIYRMAGRQKKSILKIIRELDKSGAPPPRGKGRWATATVAYLLHNPRYRPLVSDISWHLAQRALKRRDKRRAD